MTNPPEPTRFFGAEVAARYDDSLRGDEAETVALLHQLARGGPALELAIGTGRIALPLAERGIRVDGIELSDAMIARMREKPGGDQIKIVQGDMAEAALGESTRLVYLIYNTLFNLLTQEAQVRCFENAARHLTDDGVFLVEALVPNPLYGLPENQYVQAESIEDGRVTLDVGRYDPVTQLLDETHVTISSEGIRLGPIMTRCVWPSEMDLMARIAGLRLVERWCGWKREPFDTHSVRHVSVYGR